MSRPLSPPSPSSTSSSNKLVRTAWSWAVVVVVLVPLLLVSLFFGFDSSTTTSWVSPYASSSSSSSSLSLSPSANKTNSTEKEELVNFNGGHGGVGEEVQQQQKFLSSNLSTGTEFIIATPPGTLPAPAPAPAPYFTPSDDSEEEEEEDQIDIPPKKVPERDLKLDKLEYDLARAREAIRVAATNGLILEDKEYTPNGPLYLNPRAFHRSYLEMEKTFRVHVYKEGEPPIFHDGPCRSIYSTEGRFIHNMEMETKLRTRDPEEAHVHFLPYSVVKMVKLIYDRDSHNIVPLKNTIVDYINVISSRYRFWNRSLGADHFILACHDWGPYTSDASKQLFYNSIRALCNANTSEGFNPLKDVSLLEIHRREDNMAKFIGGPSASGRPILAFFVGGDHGPVRPLLLQHWKDKDKDVEVHEYLPKGVNYIDKMRRSRFCLCPSGYEVASPRIVEAIYAECVPVTINYNYVLPFSDVLNWKSFSVQIKPEDIPNIKAILQSISPRQYIRMQRRVRMVRRHFEMHDPPRRYDAYHMMLHSIWLRRLNIRIHPEDQ